MGSSSAPPPPLGGRGWSPPQPPALARGLPLPWAGLQSRMLTEDNGFLENYTILVADLWVLRGPGNMYQI